MFQILVRCERSAEFGSRCSEPNLSGFWTADDVTEAPPASFWKDYERHGWTTRGGKHYCPQHNPDLIGTQVTISRDYVEVAPGVRVRWPGAQQQGDNMHIEVQHVVPAEIEAALSDLVRLRGEDPDRERWDMVEERHIDQIIDFLRSRSAGPPPAERELAKFDSPEAKQWRANAAETMVRRAVGLPDPDGVLRTSYAGMQEWAGDVQPVEPREHVINRDKLED